MNKAILTTMALTVIALLSFSFIAAQEMARDGTGEFHEEIVAMGGQEGEGPGTGEGLGQLLQAQAGTFTNTAGRQIALERIQNRIRLRAGEHAADCNCTMLQERVQNQTRLYAQLSNGQNAEIKIMPDTAAERALERLRLRVCQEDQNCSIELKEVRERNEQRLAYELQTQRQSKVLGLFKAQMRVQAQVDAENGEVLRVNKPWWAFLASEPEETAEAE